MIQLLSVSLPNYWAMTLCEKQPTLHSFNFKWLKDVKGMNPAHLWWIWFLIKLISTFVNEHSLSFIGSASHNNILITAIIIMMILLKKGKQLFMKKREASVRFIILLHLYISLQYDTPSTTPSLHHRRRGCILKIHQSEVCKPSHIVTVNISHNIQFT